MDLFKAHGYEDGIATFIALSGELDLAAEKETRRAFERVERWNPAVLVADLTGLEFMDATGIKLLVAADRRARRAGRRLVVLTAPGGVRRLLVDIAGLDRYLELVDDLFGLNSSEGAYRDTAR